MNTITREFTKERLLKIQTWRETYGPGSNVVLPAEEAEELSRIALASVEAEPVAGEARFKEEHHWSPCTAAHVAMVLANPSDWPNYDVRYLYAAPPAPTVTFYRDGIESAAAWVDKQREEYDNEHGRHDPDTGTFEFGNDAQRDYSATLEEIAEGIRALHPNTAPPAPVVPTFDEWLEVRGNKPLGWVKDSMREAYDACRAAMLQGKAEPVSNRDELPEEKGSSLQLRNLIRQRHAEWSEKTFGNVGPIGPLKHLSKEALEAAAEPDDLSEWADMQFLLWDAQRRAGISDGEITAAMEEKLKVNMARQWPEPKDGEPRLHIKEQSESVLPEIECDICGHVSTEPEGRHHCCEDNSND